MSSPRIIPRAEHCISRADISSGALKTLYTLNEAGHEAYIVGGGVRDLLLGQRPKDFDIATSAHPEEVRALFRRCRLIGRRFRLAHVRFGDEVLEVATFRAGHQGEESDEVASQDDSGRILRDNVYGTLEEDAWRRDFSVNALYYGVQDFAIRDFVGGMEDLTARRLRLMGDPEQRYREDPVRMLRAVRLANKLGLTIESAALQQIPELAALLADAPPARLFDECLKMFFQPGALATWQQLAETGLLAQLFPQSAQMLQQDAANNRTVVEAALQNTVERMQAGQPVSPAFLFAALLWPAAEAELRSKPDAEPLVGLFTPLVMQQVQRVSIPKRFSYPMREIWELQPRFEQRGGKRPQRFAAHPRFRAAYDFMLLRAQAGQVDAEVASWWTELASQQAGSAAVAEQGSKPARRRRRRKRRPATAS